MRVTVAICTWNRCELLRRTLEQMTKLIIPERIMWELLVVNNNSTDRTNAVIDSFSDRLPIRRLFESQPGQSHARNLAVLHATGEYIIWTDDDALVDENWLNEYYEAFRRWPDAALFGGPVEPWLVGSPPQWFLQVLPQVAGVYALRELGNESIPLNEQDGVIPYGVNFAVRTEEQRQYLYDPGLGLKPGSSVRGEETAVVRAILRKGISGWWIPTARVRHYIPPDRQTIPYLRSFFFGGGRADALNTERSTSSTRKPLWMWRNAIEAEVRYRLHRLISSPTVWVEDLRMASYWWGNLGVSVFCPTQR